MRFASTPLSFATAAAWCCWLAVLRCCRPHVTRRGSTHTHRHTAGKPFAYSTNICNKGRARIVVRALLTSSGLKLHLTNSNLWSNTHERIHAHTPACHAAVAAGIFRSAPPTLPQPSRLLHSLPGPPALLPPHTRVCTTPTKTGPAGRCREGDVCCSSFYPLPSITLASPRFFLLALV